MVPLIVLTILFVSMAPIYGQREDVNVDTARLLAIDGQYEEALPLFLRLLEDKPDDAQLNYYTGVCYFFLSDSDRSLFFLEEAVSHGAEFPEAFYWLGQAYLVEQDLKEALSVTERGLRRFPRNRKLLHLHEYIQKVRAGERRPSVHLNSKDLIVPVQPPLSEEPIDDFR
ncbi:MAG TPA: tetratricopeptide repeat protein [Acidobacteriota bacterium]|nr:tetratricopeptide repeat protein [Acidobacteriota bacterium]